MTRLKNDTEDLFLSRTKNFEKLNKQTHTKPEETLEFKPTKSRETFDFSPPLSIEGSWMIGLISLEVNNSTFIITEENNKFQLYIDTFDEFSFERLKGELADNVNNSNISNDHLQDEEMEPLIFSAYRRLQTGRRMTDGYYMLLMGYATSLFRDFESYLRIVFGLDEDDTWLISKQ